MSLHELSDEQREIRELARRFADERVAPHAAAWDRAHTFPREVFAALGELGLMGVCVPADHGGAGADFLSYVLVLEELSRADAGVGVTVAVHTSACTLPLLAYGGERWVPALAQGEEIGAFALTEPGSGSDASAMRTTARDGRISGVKQWITNGSHASTFLVFAREDERISAFVVRAGADGFAVTREEEKLGLNSSSTADLAFEDTPAERLGDPGAGMRIALATLDGGRIGIAAQATGIAQAALDLATAAIPSRPASSAESATCMPRPSSPISCAAGIRAPSNSTWVVTSHARPIFRSGAPKLMPGVPSVTRNADRPRLGSGAVRAKRM